MNKACVGAGVVALGLTLSGCGGHTNSTGGSSTGSSSSSQQPTVVQIAGDWEFQGTSSVANQTYELGGTLNQSGGSLSGVVHAFDSSCFDQTVDIPVAGTVDASNNMTLTSQAASGQTISITGTLDPSGQTLNASYSIAGGCAGGDKGAVSGYKAIPLSGSFAGTFTASDGTRTQATLANLAQSASDAHGSHTLTGALTLSDASCGTPGSLSGVGAGAGDRITFALGAGTVTWQGIVSPDGKSITGSYTVAGGTCDGESGTGTVTRQ